MFLFHKMVTRCQENAGSRKEMFIGPWRVDASDLPPLTPLGRRGARSPGRSPRSPLVDMSHLSRSDPEGIGAKETPVSSFKKRRHRYLEDVCVVFLGESYHLFVTH